jgi:hypothetical protein
MLRHLQATLTSTNSKLRAQKFKNRSLSTLSIMNTQIMKRTITSNNKITLSSSSSYSRMGVWMGLRVSRWWKARTMRSQNWSRAVLKEGTRFQALLAHKRTLEPSQVNRLHLIKKALNLQAKTGTIPHPQLQATLSPPEELLEVYKGIKLIKLKIRNNPLPLKPSRKARNTGIMTL